MCPSKVGYLFNCPICKISFTICTSCYRGHRYCSSDCSFEARQRSLRRARRKYARQPYSKRLHQKRQNRYRKKSLASKDVTDHPSGINLNQLKKLLLSFDDSQFQLSSKRNLNSCGICNGTIGKVESLDSKYLRRTYGYRPRN